VTFDVDASRSDLVAAMDALDGRYVIGLVTDARVGGRSAPLDRFAFVLSGEAIGVAASDPRLFAMAAIAAGCANHQLVHVSDRVDTDAAGPRGAAARCVWLVGPGEPGRSGVRPDTTIASLAELPAALAAMGVEGGDEPAAVGVGPHPVPWPDDPRLDPELLRGGDRRNVADRYRYWRHRAIVDDLDRHRHGFHVAVENWRHDLNIGTVVRNANAFSAATVQIVGRRRWNRRGAMVTDRYQHIEHRSSIEELIDWARRDDLPIIGVDNLPGAVPIDSVTLPPRCVLLFGQEGPGLSVAARDAATLVCSIRQFGSTRSINAGVASGIAMHEWTTAHADAR
jgi:tRNA(Leu) C34 or U34 (ribose-2'-O)-methylase TrmL